MSVEFILTALVVVAAPGTGVVVTLAAGLARGARAAVVAAFGCTLGIVPHMLAAITGLAAVLHASALAFEVIRYAGVVWLLYMAWRMISDRGALRIESAGAPREDREVVVSAMLVNVLNPKLSLFFFAFLPQFVDSAAPGAVAHMTGLSLAFMAMTFVVFVLYGAFAAAARRHVLSRPRVLAWMRRAFAGAFVYLGARLALVDR